MGIEELDVYGDSALIIRQIQNKWKIKEEKLLPYFEYFQDLANKFKKIEHHYILRTQNQFADALATLASMIDIPDNTPVQPLIIKQRDAPGHCCSLESETEKDKEWYADILQFLKHGTFLDTTDKNERVTICRMAITYILCGEKLYKRSYEGIHLLCVTKKEAQHIMEEVHESSYGSHMNAHMLSRKILRLGYYWTTMDANCTAYVRKFHKCQIHRDLKHMPPVSLHCLASPWLFSS